MMNGAVGTVALGALAIVGSTADYVSSDHPFGWLGSLLLAALGGLTLWRAGSVKAWKETAEARAERLEDVERELVELRAELAIPERIEGIIHLLGEQAVRSDAAADRRLADALELLNVRFERVERIVRDACD